MAIQINGTTVIDDSRNITDVEDVGNTDTVYYGDGSNLTGLPASWLPLGTIDANAATTVDITGLDNTYSKYKIVSDNFKNFSSETNGYLMTAQAFVDGTLGGGFVATSILQQADGLIGDPSPSTNSRAIYSQFASLTNGVIAIGGNRLHLADISLIGSEFKNNNFELEIQGLGHPFGTNFVNMTWSLTSSGCRDSLGQWIYMIQQIYGSAGLIFNTSGPENDAGGSLTGLRISISAPNTDADIPDALTGKFHLYGQL